MGLKGDKTVIPENALPAKVAIRNASTLLHPLYHQVHHQSPAYPINSLTEELLSRILTEAVDEEEDRPWTRRVELTAVCRRWRRVALDCAVFWVGIPLEPSRWWISPLEKRQRAS